jgi:hypothetical protein
MCLHAGKESWTQIKEIIEIIEISYPFGDPDVTVGLPLLLQWMREEENSLSRVIFYVVPFFSDKIRFRALFRKNWSAMHDQCTCLTVYATLYSHISPLLTAAFHHSSKKTGVKQPRVNMGACRKFCVTKAASGPLYTWREITV